MSDGTASKAEFAALCNVSRSCVSQWISRRHIPPEALIGEGRKARIHVERAAAALGKSLDVSQRLGNGIATRLPRPGPAAPAVELDPVEERIKAEKLREIQFRNRAAAIREAEEAGKYVLADQARTATAKAVGTVVQAFDASVPELAAAIAAEFKVPARDVTHVVRRVMRATRAQLAQRLEAEAASLPATVEDHVLVQDETTAGEA